MIESIVFVVVAVILLLIVLRLAWKPVAPPPAVSPESKLPIEELFPLHSRHFPQVHQALSVSDRVFLKERGSRALQRRSRAERLEVAREFLRGLREDFVRLDRLGRTVAALSPEINRKQEAERFWLGLRFHLVYQLAWLSLGFGSAPLPQLARLSDLVGSLAAQIEGGMKALEQAAVVEARSGLSA